MLVNYAADPQVVQRRAVNFGSWSIPCDSMM
jgi:hypothetical protein